MKLVFDYIHLKICFLQLLQNELDMNLVLKFIVKINQDVIQISCIELIKLIIELSFNINLLTWLKYSILIFWLNSNTWFQHSDSIWYWSQVNTQFKFSTWLIKKSKMILNVKIYYFWIYYIIIFETLTWNKWIYFSSHCLHYLVALSIKYIARCLILIKHMNYQDLWLRKNLISRSFIHLLSVVFILMNLQVKIHETLIRISSKRNKFFKKWWIKFIAILVTSVSRLIRLNKAEALINSQCMLASTLHNN